MGHIYTKSKCLVSALVVSKHTLGSLICTTNTSILYKGQDSARNSSKVFSEAKCLEVICSKWVNFTGDFEKAECGRCCQMTRQI